MTATMCASEIQTSTLLHGKPTPSNPNTVTTKRQTMTNLNDSFPELKIEHLNDGMGDGLILLEQDSSGTIDRVAIHPIQLRYMAEKMGLVESSDPLAQKTIATLTRRLLVLRDRVDHLAYRLCNNSDTAHADLDYEQTYATATTDIADIADEFCAELGRVQPCTEPPKQAPESVKPLAGTDTRQMSIDA